jgi:hypothetical protein
MTVAPSRRACQRRIVLRRNRFAIAAAVAAVACASTFFPTAATAQGIWGPYGWYPPFAYAYGRPYSSLRLQISPSETEVFVDGYYAGVVDDFDGFMQRLRVEAGEHTIQLYLNGRRTTAPPSQSIVVEKIPSGFVFAPDFKATEVDDRFAQLAGASAGRMTDDTQLVGGAAYWLDVRVRISDEFSVFEPQGNLAFHVTDRMAITGAAGYRAVAATDALRDTLDGPTISLGLQFGW